MTRIGNTDEGGTTVLLELSIAVIIMPSLRSGPRQYTYPHQGYLLSTSELRYPFRAPAPVVLLPLLHYMSAAAHEPSMVSLTTMINTSQDRVIRSMPPRAMYLG